MKFIAKMVGYILKIRLRIGVYMEIKQINSFLTVVETGSFSKAAQHLYLSQPAISSHIKQLEQEVQATLIDRSKKKVELTQAGKEFAQFARSINNTCQDIQMHFLFKHHNTVQIGASSVPSSQLIPDIMQRFYRKHPRTKFILEENDSQSIIDAVQKGDLTLGLVGKTQENSDLIFEPLCNDKLIIVTPNNPYYQKAKMLNRSIQDFLTSESLILKMEKSGTYEAALHFVDSLGLSLNDLRVIARISSTTTIKNFVQSGMGITLLSQLSVAEELHTQKLLPLFEDQFFNPRHYFLVYRKDLVQTAIIHDLIQEIRLLSPPQ